MDPRFLDDIISTLQVERDRLATARDIDEHGRPVDVDESSLSESEKADLATVREIDEILTKARALKDRLTDQDARAVREMDLLPMLEKRVEMGQIGAVYNPFAYGDFEETTRTVTMGFDETDRREVTVVTDVWNRAALERLNQSISERGVTRSQVHESSVQRVRDQVREHRRTQTAHLREAIERHQQLVEQTLKEDRETPSTHAKRIHRERKIDGLVLIYNLQGREPGKPKIEPEHVDWYKMQVRKDLGSKLERSVAEPPKAIRKLYGRMSPVNPHSAGVKVIKALEILRKNLLVIKSMLASLSTDHEVDFKAVKSLLKTRDDITSTPGDAAVIARLIKAKHQTLIEDVIEEHCKTTDILHYACDYEVDDTFSSRGYEIKNRNNTMRWMLDQSSIKTYEHDQSHFSDHFFAKSPDSQLSVLAQLFLMLQIEQPGVKKPNLNDTARNAITLRCDTAIVTARKVIYDLQDSKHDRDNVDRIYKEIRSLGRAPKLIKEQIKVWNQSMEFLRQQYKLLYELDEENQAKFKEGVVAVCGALLRSRGILLGTEKSSLLDTLEAAKGSSDAFLTTRYEPEQKFGTGEVLPHTEWAGWWIGWCLKLRERDRNFSKKTAFKQRIGNADMDGLKKARTMAFILCERIMLERSYLVTVGEADLSVRDEVDWVQYSRDLEDLVRRANGLIIYVKQLEGSHKTIKHVVGKVLKEMTDSGYPRVGEASVSISVALAVEGEIWAFKAGAELVFTITGTLTHEDDRRVRFKGSFSVDVKASLDVGAPLDDIRDKHTGDEDESHSIHSINWIDAKAALSAEKGLLSTVRVYVYTDTEHLAASWAHKLAMAKVYLSKPLARITSPFDRSAGLDVVNVRDDDEEGERVLKLVLGDDSKLTEVLELVRRPVVNASTFTQGLTNWGDLQVAGDVSLNMVAGVSLHAERLTHNQKNTHFWKDSYDQGTHKVLNWAPKQKAGDDEAPTECVDVVTDSWGKAYPPLVGVGLGYAVSSYSPTPPDPNKLFSIAPTQDSTSTVTELFSIGYSQDVSVSFDIGFDLVRRHPNPDDEGFTLDIKATRQRHITGKPYAVEFAFNKTLNKPLNRREIRFFGHMLKDLADELSEGCTTKVELDEEKEPDPEAKAKTVVDHAMSGGGGRLDKLKFGRLRRKLHALREVFRHLTAYGTIEVLLDYTADSKKPRWIMQYLRVWRSFDVDLSGKIPTGVPGFDVGLGLKCMRSFGLMEVIGPQTVAYVQTVFDGISARLTEQQKSGAVKDWLHWKDYRTTHQQEFMEICRQLSIKNTADPPTSFDQEGSLAHVEVAADKAEGGDLGTAAGALLDGCKLEETNPYDADTTPPSSSSGTSTPTTALVTRMSSNTLRLRTLDAVAVVLLDRLTGEVSTSWPKKVPDTGTPPPNEGYPQDTDFAPRQLFYVNPKGEYDILAVVQHPENASKIELKLDPSGLEKELEAADEASAPPPPPTGTRGTLKKIVDKAKEALEISEVCEEDDSVVSRFAADLREEYADQGVTVYRVPLTDATIETFNRPLKITLTLTPDSDAVDVKREEAWTYFYSLKLDLLDTFDTYLKAKCAAIAAEERTWHWIDEKGEQETELVIMDPDDDTEDMGSLEYDPEWTEVEAPEDKGRYLVFYCEDPVLALDDPATLGADTTLCTIITHDPEDPPTDAAAEPLSNISGTYDALYVYGSKGDVRNQTGAPTMFNGSETKMSEHLAALTSLDFSARSIILDFSFSMYSADLIASKLTEEGKLVGCLTDFRGLKPDAFFTRINEDLNEIERVNLWHDAFKAGYEALTNPKGCPFGVLFHKEKKVYRSNKSTIKKFIQAVLPASEVANITERAINAMHKRPETCGEDSYRSPDRLARAMERRRIS